MRSHNFSPSCPSQCGVQNFKRREKCFKCGVPKAGAWGLGGSAGAVGFWESVGRLQRGLGLLGPQGSYRWVWGWAGPCGFMGAGRVPGRGLGWGNRPWEQGPGLTIPVDGIPGGLGVPGLGCALGGWSSKEGLGSNVMFSLSLLEAEQKLPPGGRLEVLALGGRELSQGGLLPLPQPYPAVLAQPLAPPEPSADNANDSECL